MRHFGRFYREEFKKPGPYPSKLQENDLQAYVDYLRSTRGVEPIPTIYRNKRARQAKTTLFHRIVPIAP
jgi:hypothetical protein